MNAIILKGDPAAKATYIDDYIRDNNIPSYNIVRFDEPLKISDARQIKKSLIISTAGTKRLIIIEADPNTESQNALLKTLEELDAPTDFIFSNQSELLPTVVSRCSVIVLGLDEQPVAATNDSLIAAILNEDDLGLSLSSVEKFFVEKKEDPLGELILGLRNLLVEKIYRADEVSAYRVYKMLKSLQDNYPLVVSNNVNSRLVLEKILLTNATV